MKQRTITALLAVVAVLLAANLVVSAPSREARAHNTGPPVMAVELNVTERDLGPGEGRAYLVLRLWSDGTVERNLGFMNLSWPYGCVSVDWCGWETVPE